MRIINCRFNYLMNVLKIEKENRVRFVAKLQLLSFQLLRSCLRIKRNKRAIEIQVNHHKLKYREMLFKLSKLPKYI